MKKPSKLPKTV